MPAISDTRAACSRTGVLNAMRKLGLSFVAVTVLGLSGMAQNRPAAPRPRHSVRNAKNPFARVIVIPFEYDAVGPIGSYSRLQSGFTVQPLIPFLLGPKLDLITQTTIPVLAQPDLQSPRGRDWGMGDVTTSLYFSPDNQTKLHWGLGPAFQFPTASDQALGSGKWGAGFSAAVVGEPGRWTLGVATTSIQSFAGDPSREDINYLTVNYQVTNNFAGHWYVTSSPTIGADWKAAPGNRWLVPFGLGFGRVVGAGSRQLSAEVGAYYSLIHPRSAPYPKWLFSLQVAWAHTESWGIGRH